MARDENFLLNLSTLDDPEGVTLSVRCSTWESYEHMKRRYPADPEKYEGGEQEVGLAGGRTARYYETGCWSEDGKRCGLTIRGPR